MSKITFSEILQSTTLENLNKLAENKPKIFEVLKMDEKYGIAATIIVLDNGFKLIHDGLDTFSDGLQITDAMFVFNSLDEFKSIISNAKDVKLELQDLSIEEIKELSIKYGAKIFEILIGIKNKPNSGN